jgi:hypothetical protein
MRWPSNLARAALAAAADMGRGEGLESGSKRIWEEGMGVGFGGERIYMSASLRGQSVVLISCVHCWHADAHLLRGLC